MSEFSGVRLCDVSRRLWLKECPGLVREWLEAAETCKGRLAALDTLELKTSHERHGSLSTFSIHVLDAESRLVGEVGVSRGQYLARRFFFEWPWIRKVMVNYQHQVSETVDEALKRLAPRSRETRRIVVYQGYHSQAHFITVHRVPSGVDDALEWFKLREEEEREKFSSSLYGDASS